MEISVKTGVALLQDIVVAGLLFYLKFYFFLGNVSVSGNIKIGAALTLSGCLTLSSDTATITITQKMIDSAKQRGSIILVHGDCIFLGNNQRIVDEEGRSIPEFSSSQCSPFEFPKNSQTEGAYRIAPEGLFFEFQTNNSPNCGL